MRFTIDNLKNVKLVVWDLDDTFWEGTLSENDTELPIHLVQDNIMLVKRLSERGIVNSICSKNDKNKVEQILRDYTDIESYFVFNSINWEPKGARLKKLIDVMALRPSNVLFLDDNPTNLAEAEFLMPDIMVSGPDIIPTIISLVDTIGKNDEQLSRLQQYKVLEKKHVDAESFSSNLDFLRSSGIRISINNDVENVQERVLELIQRTNQLNFTKKRISNDELKSIISNDMYQTGYVIAEDNYGKYGIVGFYALKENTLEHFLFSCRTMGMGIEQYVYAYLNYPSLNIVEPVSGTVSCTIEKPDYITLIDMTEKAPSSIESPASILLKGPCDLQIIASYLEGANQRIDCEFNFIDINGNQEDFYNHTINILNTYKLTDTQKRNLYEKYSFISKEAFETKIFKNEYRFICLSPLMDATLAVYANKNNNILFPFGLYNKPMTDEKYWSEYIEKKVATARSNFKLEELESFRREYEVIDYMPKQIAENLSQIVDLASKTSSKASFIILLLAELPFEGKKEEFLGKEKIHVEINRSIKEKFKGDKRVYLLDVNKYITKQTDYFDNINHYSKLVYYKIATELVEYIQNKSNISIKISSKFYALYMNFRREIYKRFFLRKK